MSVELLESILACNIKHSSLSTFASVTIPLTLFATSNSVVSTAISPCLSLLQHCPQVDEVCFEAFDSLMTL